MVPLLALVACALALRSSLAQTTLLSAPMVYCCTGCERWCTPITHVHSALPLAPVQWRRLELQPSLCWCWPYGSRCHRGYRGYCRSVLWRDVPSGVEQCCSVLRSWANIQSSCSAFGRRNFSGGRECAVGETGVMRAEAMGGSEWCAACERGDDAS